MNGNIWILKPSREKCEVISHNRLLSKHGEGLDEIYSSPAISNGRVVFVTRDRTICIGKKDATPSDTKPQPLPEEKAAGEKVAHLQLRPYEVVLQPGKPVKYTLVAFDENGREIKRIQPALKAGENLAGINVSGCLLYTSDAADE